jgi:hypothetical protein
MVVPNELPNDKPVIALTMPPGTVIHLDDMATLERYPHGWMLDMADDSCRYYIIDSSALDPPFPE